jgi:hypothetical protein
MTQSHASSATKMAKQRFIQIENQTEQTIDMEKQGSHFNVPLQENIIDHGFWRYGCGV